MISHHDNVLISDICPKTGKIICNTDSESQICKSYNDGDFFLFSRDTLTKGWLVLR